MILFSTFGDIDENVVMIGNIELRTSVCEGLWRRKHMRKHRARVTRSIEVKPSCSGETFSCILLINEGRSERGKEEGEKGEGRREKGDVQLFTPNQ